jgi:hypothetical protein
MSGKYRYSYINIQDLSEGNNRKTYNKILDSACTPETKARNTLKNKLNKPSQESKSINTYV